MSLPQSWIALCQHVKELAQGCCAQWVAQNLKLLYGITRSQCMNEEVQVLFWKAALLQSQTAECNWAAMQQFTEGVWEEIRHHMATQVQFY